MEYNSNLKQSFLPRIERRDETIKHVTCRLTITAPIKLIILSIKLLAALNLSLLGVNQGGHQDHRSINQLDKSG
jgi:hypothetical protein